MCFKDKEFYGFDKLNSAQKKYPESNPGPLIIRSIGNDDIPENGITFAKRDDNIIYGFGGEYQYVNTNELFNTLYKIKIKRRDWEDYDIVFLEWTLVKTSGNIIPPKQKWAPIWSFYNELYLLSSENKKHQMYRLTFDNVNKNAEWFLESDLEHSSSVLNIDGNIAKQIYVYLKDSSGYTFTKDSSPQWTLGAPTSNVTDVSLLSDGQPIPPEQQLKCSVHVMNRTIFIGDNAIASFTNPSLKIILYLEEWLNIDYHSNADTVKRVRNAIQWHVKTNKTLSQMVSESSEVFQLNALEFVSRLYMHQARWTLKRDMFVKYNLLKMMSVNNIQYIRPRTTEPNEDFLSIFTSSSPSLFGDKPTTNPSEFAVRWEGDTFKRSMIVVGNFKEMQNYEQEIDFESEILIVRASWTSTSLRIRFKRKVGLGSSGGSGLLGFLNRKNPIENYKFQLGFIQGVVYPLYHALELVPEVDFSEMLDAFFLWFPCVVLSNSVLSEFIAI